MLLGGLVYYISNFICAGPLLNRFITLDAFTRPSVSEVSIYLSRSNRYLCVLLGVFLNIEMEFCNSLSLGAKTDHIDI